MFKKLTSALLLGAMLVFGAAVANATVDHYVTTGTGNDTLYVGVPGVIEFHADANGDTVAALSWPMVYTFTNGNIIGPLADNAADPSWHPTAPAAVFESQAWNAAYGTAATDPDSTLLGQLDFGGTAWTVNAVSWTINFTPLDTGTILVDTGTVAGQSLGAVGLDANPRASTWVPKLITVVVLPNQPPVCDDVSGVGGPYTFGSNITGICANFTDPDSLPGPLTYFIASAVNSNATGPNNAMSVDGSGCFSWQTSNANTDDVGVWTIQIGATDGLDTAYCEFQLTVISQTPFCFHLDTISTLVGSTVQICVTLQKDAGLELAGGFDLLICFDCSILTFNGATVGQALIDHEWEFFTYRLESTNPCKVRLVAIADMNNSNVHPDSTNPVGEVACLNFKVTNDQTVACQKAAIRFCWEDCGDNTVSSRDGYTLWIVGENAGGIIDINGNQIFGVVPDPWGFNATVVAAGCPDDKYDIVPFVCFTNGWIRVICPGEIDDRGDLNLNGLAYEIADAVLYSNYFIWGSGALDPVYYQAQIAASDINNDGAALTVADLVYLIRVITGDASPVPDDFVGKAGLVAGTLNVVSAQQGNNVTVKASSELNLGAMVLVFKAENAEISNVNVAGRASDMAVGYNAANGELRVVVMPSVKSLESKSAPSIVAGEGEVLTFEATGKVELVKVEAATENAEAVTAKATGTQIPTEFTLHQNFPNPFNPSTELAIGMPKAGEYSLSIYNIAGQTVKTFAGSAEAGTLRIVWDGTNGQGAKVASGVYFYKAEANGNSAVKKMLLMK
jgi:hypothetical protein